MANSVDPDQTAPLGGLIWVRTVCLGLSVQKLRIITVSGSSAGFSYLLAMEQHLSHDMTNQQNDCVPSEDSDQPGHPPSLISLRCVLNR